MNEQLVVLSEAVHEEVTRRVLDDILVRVRSLRRTNGGRVASEQDVENRATLLKWLVLDAFSVDVAFEQLWTHDQQQLARHLVALMPRNRWGHTPMTLFWYLRSGIASDGSIEPTGWNAHARSIRRSLPRSRRHRCIDWGTDTLLFETRARPECMQMLDAILYRLTDALDERLPTMGQLVNYLWRLSVTQTDARTPIPRFAICTPITRDSLSSDLSRLLAVMGYSDAVAVPHWRPLDEILKLPRETSVANVFDAKICVAFELRATFGVRGSRFRELFWGDLHSRLPRRVRTFGDLITYATRYTTLPRGEGATREDGPARGNGPGSLLTH